jgi:DNA invertase Pin-like site-specific DNA recombinase
MLDIKRVAAYARVSCDKDAMLHSLSAQISYYSDYIRSHPGWEYAGIYADEGITGTKDKRPEFRRLIEDCRAGKIDIVLTKSISRFARNTVTLLEVVRELKSLNVDVWFEKEGIRSLSGEGELILSLLASVAQEESFNVSENCKWRIRKNFQEGRPASTLIYGYKLIDGTFTIIPEEAEVVKFIYENFMNGMGKNTIAGKLNLLSIPTKRGGNWNESVINDMLRNEKYIGDLLLQKTFTEDHISKKQCINNGEFPKYYVENSHLPIISKDVFLRVQQELARRAARFGNRGIASEPNPYSGRVTCGCCGKRYYRKLSGAHTPYEQIVWMCATYSKKGKAACASRQIPEYILNKNVDADFNEIRIQSPNTLVILMPDGTEIIKHWNYKPRSDGWTDDMKLAASSRRYIQKRTEKGTEKGTINAKRNDNN